MVIRTHFIAPSHVMKQPRHPEHNPNMLQFTAGAINNGDNKCDQKRVVTRNEVGGVQERLGRKERTLKEAGSGKKTFC